MPYFRSLCVCYAGQHFQRTLLFCQTRYPPRTGELWSSILLVLRPFLLRGALLSPLKDHLLLWKSFTIGTDLKSHQRRCKIKTQSLTLYEQQGFPPDTPMLHRIFCGTAPQFPALGVSLLYIMMLHQTLWIWEKQNETKQHNCKKINSLTREKSQKEIKN